MSLQADNPIEGRYRPIRRLGVGGSAVVHLAEDERLGRKVALKRLHGESGEELVRRFGREARVGASLNHPNIVAVYDTLVDDEGVVIVMEYVEGETLGEALARGPLELARSLEILTALAAALDNAHAAGVVHRDVKPANVLLGADGSVKLADLGIASAIEATRITSVGTVLGTPQYMSPEQLAGEPTGPHSDIYSFGALAFELLAGRSARASRSPIELANELASEPVPDLRDARPETPAGAAELLRAAMAREPDQRPESAGLVAAGLRRAFEGGSPAESGLAPTVSAPPPAEAPPAAGAAPSARTISGTGPSRPLVVLGALAASVAVIALATGLIGGQDRERGDGRSAERADRDRERTAVEPAPATAESTAAAEIDPARGADLDAEGKALIDAGRPEEAIPVLEQAVASFDPESRELGRGYALYNLGHALRLAERPAEAIPILEQRLEIDDQLPTVRRELELARDQAAAQGN